GCLPISRRSSPSTTVMTRGVASRDVNNWRPQSGLASTRSGSGRIGGVQRLAVVLVIASNRRNDPETKSLASSVPVDADSGRRSPARPIPGGRLPRGGAGARRRAVFHGRGDLRAPVRAGRGPCLAL